MKMEFNLKDFAEEYINKGKKKFGRNPTYDEIEDIIDEEKEQMNENGRKNNRYTS